MAPLKAIAGHSSRLVLRDTLIRASSGISDSYTGLLFPMTLYDGVEPADQDWGRRHSCGTPERRRARSTGSVGAEPGLDRTVPMNRACEHSAH